MIMVSEFKALVKKNQKTIWLTVTERAGLTGATIDNGRIVAAPPRGINP
jgi:hypothetical protein